VFDRSKNSAWKSVVGFHLLCFDKFPTIFPQLNGPSFRTKVSRPGATVLIDHVIAVNNNVTGVADPQILQQIFSRQDTIGIYLMCDGSTTGVISTVARIIHSHASHTLRNDNTTMPSQSIQTLFSPDSIVMDDGHKRSTLSFNGLPSLSTKGGAPKYS
jgi:hypothetical protein